MKKILVGLIIAILVTQFALLSSAFAVGQPDVQRAVFVHYASHAAKPQPPSGDSGSYKTFAKWSVTPVKYTINPVGSRMSGNEVNIVTLAAGEWDEGDVSNWGGVTRNLFNYAGSSNKDYADFSARDGENTIAWGNYPQSGVIAVTFIWYTRTRQILEFDMLFDTDWTWGNVETSGNGVMDLQNIATHELGHAVGLSDLYKPTATLETMYGYSDYGDTIKRSLYFGDIAGIKSLYG